MASLRNMWRGVLISRMRRWRLSGSGTHPQFKPTAHHTWSQSHPVNHGAELGSKLDLTSSPLLLCCCRLLDRNAPNASSARPPACCDVRSLKRGPGIGGFRPGKEDHLVHENGLNIANTRKLKSKTQSNTTFHNEACSFMENNSRI